MHPWRKVSRPYRVTQCRQGNTYHLIKKADDLRKRLIRHNDQLRTQYPKKLQPYFYWRPAERKHPTPDLGAISIGRRRHRLRRWKRVGTKNLRVRGYDSVDHQKGWTVEVRWRTIESGIIVLHMRWKEFNSLFGYVMPAREGGGTGGTVIAFWKIEFRTLKYLKPLFISMV